MDEGSSDALPRDSALTSLSSPSQLTHIEISLNSEHNAKKDLLDLSQQELTFMYSLPPEAVCSPNEDDDMEDVPLDIINLQMLPAEIFLHICSYLDAKFIINVLSHVCQSFRYTIMDNTFWKVRIAKRWPKKYPAIAVNNATFNWKDACIAREEQNRLWSAPDSTTDYYRFTEGLFASVDCVHLMQEGRIMVSGSRDRQLSVVDLKTWTGGEGVATMSIMQPMRDAHKGWVWCLASCGDQLASGSWDRHIKFWDMAADGQLVADVRCKSAVLCSHLEHNLLIAGAYDKLVYHIDPRSGAIAAESSYHTRPVLCLAASDHHVVSGSEDGTVQVWDRRAGRLYKQIKLPAYPMSMSFGDDQLWVGDKLGALHLIDASDGDFDLVGSYCVGHAEKVTGVQHGLGAVLTCSTDRSVRVLQPTPQPDPIIVLDQGSRAHVAGIHFSNDILVSANSDCSVGVWIPKDYEWR